MKKIVMIFAAMAAVLSSCQKSELESVSENESKDIVLNISVSNPGAGTKALIKEGWVNGDEISIWYDTNIGTNPDLVITYNGTKWIQKQGATVSDNTPSTSGGYAKALYNGTVKVASKDNYTYENNTLTFNIENWKFLTEVQVVVKGLTSTSAGSYTLACDKFTPLGTGNGYTVNTDGITAFTGKKGDAVTGISNTDGVAFVFATADYSSTAAAFKFTLTDNTSTPAVTKVYTTTTDKINGTSGAMTAIKALTIASDKFAKAAPEGFVDLGLSSGIFWAEKNLGASNPWEYGTYFSWGDVTGQKTNSSGWLFNQSFDWDNDVFGEHFNKVEKETACPDGILATTYDAAYKTNSSWRMPTTGDFEELFSNCYVELDTYNNVYGLIVYKAKSEDDKGYAYFDGQMRKYPGTGNDWDTTEKTRPGYSTSSDTFVFFPAAGYGEDSYLCSEGSEGFYWSSSLSTEDTDAYQLRFSYEVYPQDNYYRHYGGSVRPVSD